MVHLLHARMSQRFDVFAEISEFVGIISYWDDSYDAAVAFCARSGVPCTRTSR